MNIPIFVINLDKDKERLSFIKNQFEGKQYSINRFPAITPSDISESMYANVDYLWIQQKYAPVFRPGEVACAFSHKAIYEKISQEKIPISLIMEDDVILDKAFFTFLRKLELSLSQNKKPKWEYLQCNYHIMDWVNFQRFFNETLNRARRATLLQRMPLLLKIIIGVFLFLFELLLFFLARFIGHIVIKPYRPYYMAGTYFITYDWAQKILSTMDWKIIAPADIIQNIAKKENWLKLRMLLPQLSVQDPSFESNTLTLK